MTYQDNEYDTRRNNRRQCHIEYGPSSLQPYARGGPVVACPKSVPTIPVMVESSPLTWLGALSSNWGLRE